MLFKKGHHQFIESFGIVLVHIMGGVGDYLELAIGHQLV
jgi:hypothetical protein